MQWQQHEPGLMSDCWPHIYESIEEQLNTVAALEVSGALKEEVESGEGEPTMALLHSEMRTYYTYDTACSLQNVDT